jgi:hypothetical protein
MCWNARRVGNNRERIEYPWYSGDEGEGLKRSESSDAKWPKNSV